MKSITSRILIITIVLLQLLSCRKTDEAAPPTFTDQTIIMYLPWTGNLTSFLYNNMCDMGEALATRASENERVICFYATSPTKATLIEMRYYNGSYRQTTLKEYTQGVFTTATDISAFITTVKELAPSNRYSMIASAHGTAWLPIGTPITTYSSIATEHNNQAEPLLMRYFGALTQDYQISITTLAEGIEGSGTHLEYLLFDACYMSNIDVVYALKDVTDYLIASPIEVLSHGFPYADMGDSLFGEVNYQKIVEEFYNFYINYRNPYGAVAVVDMQQVDRLADIMQTINSRYTFRGDMTTIQSMDTFNPSIFFDLVDYVDNLCVNDTELLSQFNAQIIALVPYKAHTPSFYKSTGNISINSYSGVTTSDPTLNSLASTKSQTAWYGATH